MLNVEYATQIARDRNVKDAASGFAGYVTSFLVDAAHAARYEVHQVGGSQHQELWVPAGSQVLMPSDSLTCSSLILRRPSRSHAAPHVLSARELLGRTDAVWTALGRAHIELLGLLAEADRREAWRDEGAEDVCHWVSIRYGISMWKAARWVEAGHSLPSLPLVSKALASGRLGIDHVVEPAGSQPPGPSNDSPPGRASVPPGRSDAGPTSSDVAAVTK